MAAVTEGAVVASAQQVQANVKPKAKAKSRDALALQSEHRIATLEHDLTPSSNFHVRIR